MAGRAHRPRGAAAQGHHHAAGADVRPRLLLHPDPHPRGERGPAADHQPAQPRTRHPRRARHHGDPRAARRTALDAEDQARRRPPGRRPAAVKVYGSEARRDAYALLMEILAAAGPLKEGSAGAVLHGELERGYRSAVIFTFDGGTNEIQREIISRQAPCPETPLTAGRRGE
ncbi:MULTISPECIES: acyl-CoA dehydrogenase family protein [Streptomyces]|uniref:Acyl-CoA dehydrogenase family protein n=1 Tax=Streptomyces eurythermus TaxID=42237 RepID=A0ABW6Z2Q3_9ACTN|nr:MULTISPECIES: acyl-CoA dehydrogenase family protein [Streptomyces]